jgi:hypothetical protein
MDAAPFIEGQGGDGREHAILRAALELGEHCVRLARHPHEGAPPVLWVQFPIN